MMGSRYLCGGLALALLVPGCFAIASTDEFTQDEGCDLELDLENFSPHLDQLVEVRLVHERAPMDEGAPQLLFLGTFDPLTRRNVSMDIPGAVPALLDPDRPRHQIDFFADLDGSGGYSGEPDDHSWTVEDVCAPGRDPAFPHNFLFDPLQEVAAPGTSLFIDFCPNLDMGDSIGPIAPFDGDEPLEVRVTGTLPPLVPGMPEETRPVAYYRLGALAAADRGIRIPVVFDEGFPYRVEIFVDENENFAFDDSVDQGWVYNYDPGSASECEPLAETRTCGLTADTVTVVPACKDGSDIRVRLSRTHIANTGGDILDAAWVTVPEGT